LVVEFSEQSKLHKPHLDLFPTLPFLLVIPMDLVPARLSFLEKRFGDGTIKLGVVAAQRVIFNVHTVM
jgi:hypothetical protein